MIVLYSYTHHQKVRNWRFRTEWGTKTQTQCAASQHCADPQVEVEWVESWPLTLVSWPQKLTDLLVLIRKQMFNQRTSRWSFHWSKFRGSNECRAYWFDTTVSSSRYIYMGGSGAFNEITQFPSVNGISWDLWPVKLSGHRTRTMPVW